MTVIDGDLDLRWHFRWRPYSVYQLFWYLPFSNVYQSRNYYFQIRIFKKNKRIKEIKKKKKRSWKHWMCLCNSPLWVTVLFPFPFPKPGWLKVFNPNDLGSVPWRLTLMAWGLYPGIEKVGRRGLKKKVTETKKEGLHLTFVGVVDRKGWIAKLIGTQLFWYSLYGHYRTFLGTNTLEPVGRLDLGTSCSILIYVHMQYLQKYIWQPWHFLN